MLNHAQSIIKNIRIEKHYVKLMLLYLYQTDTTGNRPDTDTEYWYRSEPGSKRNMACQHSSKAGISRYHLFSSQLCTYTGSRQM